MSKDLLPDPARRPQHYKSTPAKAPDGFFREIVAEEKPVYKAPVGFKPRMLFIEDASKKDYVIALENDLKDLKDYSYESIDRLMKKLSKEFGISPRKLHNDFKAKHGKTPDEWVTPKMKEEVKPPSEMELLAEKISNIAPEKKKLTTEDYEVLKEQKLFQVEKQLYDLRKLVLEVSQTQDRHGTLVSGLGHAGGGGEVRLFGLDDTEVGPAQDGDALVWDDFMQKWVPSSSVGGTGDSVALNRRITRLEGKLFSMDSRIADIIASNDIFLKLESGTTQPGDTDTVFYDTVSDGDTTRFIVGKDSQRGVYTLNGVPQPTVQLPRGDILEFDVSGLSTPGNFEIYINGITLEEGNSDSQAYSRDGNIITVNTQYVDPSISKLYYKDTQVTGLGWVIVIT